MDDRSLASRRPVLAEVTKLWWMPVLLGVVLIVYAFVVLSFTIETVWAVAVLLGVGLLLSGIGHLGMASMVRDGR